MISSSTTNKLKKIKIISTNIIIIYSRYSAGAIDRAADII